VTGKGLPMSVPKYKDRRLLHKEGEWSLVGTNMQTIVGHQGWRSVIEHNCSIKGSPYWMLIEHHADPTVCVYCKEAMPWGIVALFKLLNAEVMR
jgi:hypothetical protein